MPREIRKRGKKKAKEPREDDVAPPPALAVIEPQQDGPSWMRHAAPSGASPDSEAPFGFVDADVKAYFRTVDAKLREWQDGTGGEVSGMADMAFEERQPFVMAALTEMNGKELQLATDPDTSIILERLAYSMDDFARRVFLDKIAGSFVTLAKHRFGSHVCQTHFSLAKTSIYRETAAQLDANDASELRSVTQLVIDASEELLESISSLIMDQFGSHVIRVLATTLSPTSPSHLDFTDNDNLLRSKKSAAFKARQGSLKSVLVDSVSQPTTDTGPAIPSEFKSLTHRFVEKLRNDLSDNEIRALGSDKVASPTLQVMLRLEAVCGEAERPGSLMDRVLMGLISDMKSEGNITTRSDYIETLLRDPTSSHLIESLIAYSPPPVFDTIWSTYFTGRLNKLAVHPVANFVVARAIGRLEGSMIAEVMGELGSAFGRSIRLGRTGVHRALIDQAASTQHCEGEVAEVLLHSLYQFAANIYSMTMTIKALCNGFGLGRDSDRTLLVPCMLRLQTLEDYQAAALNTTSLNAVPVEHPPDTHSGLGRRTKQRASPQFSTQGAILLQSMLRLHPPHNQVVIDSIKSLSIDDLLAIACDSTGSRVLDVVLEQDAPTILPSARRMLVMRFLDHFHTLVDDKLGSRVADRCWATSDPYLRERIARSLIPHENFVLGSFYGKFFARNLHLTLLKRKPEEWKILQSKARSTASKTFSATNKPAVGPTLASEVIDDQIPNKEKKKRKRDDIEEIFNGGSSEQVAVTAAPPKLMLPQDPGILSGKIADMGLADVLGAIKEIPKGQALREGRRHKKTKV